MAADDRRPRETANLSDPVLEEINRMWTVVRALTNAAHEVNNALQVISGSAELLETQGLPPQAAKRVAAIRVEAVKAAATIEQLAAYARGDGRAPRPVDIAPLLERAVAMRSASVRRLRIALTLDLRNAGPCWAVLDSNLTLQMLLDLLLAAEEAAKRFTDARVTVALEVTEQVVTVNVRIDGAERESTAPTAEALEIDALTRGAQLWAAARLAESQGGLLETQEGSFVLTFPAYNQPV